MSKNDFGASHQFKAKPEKLIKSNELRISRTIYMKVSHLERLAAISENEGINLSSAFDLILQRGLAFTLQLEVVRDIANQKGKQ